MQAVLCKSLLLAGVLAIASPAVAQTGRIAHLSHGGSVAALAAHPPGADNFGIVPMPPTETKVDSLVYVTDSTAVRYTHQRVGYYQQGDKLGWKPVRESSFQYYYPRYERLSRGEVIAKLRKEYATAKFIGFDQKQPDRGHKAKHKKAALVRPPLPRPRSPWHGVALMTGLVGLGGLLAGKSCRPDPEAIT